MSARTSLIYLGARVLSGALSMLAIALFARGVGPEGYGWLTLAMAGSAVAGGIFIQPVHQSLARFLPRAGFESLLPTLARVLWGLSGVLLLLAVGVETLVKEQWLRLPAGVALAAWALCSAQGMFDFAAQHANSRMQAGQYAALYVAKSLLVVGVGFFVLQMGWGKQGLVAANVMAFSLASGVIARLCWQKAWQGYWTPALLKQVQPYALPLAASCFLSMLLSWSDRFVLSHFLGVYDTGLYAAVADLAQQSLGLLFSALFLAWYPRMVSATEKQQPEEVSRLMSRYAALMLAVLLPSALGFVLVRDNLVQTFLGAAYGEGSRQVLPWLTGAAALGGLRMYLLEIPLHLGSRMPALLRNVACCAVISIALNIGCVERFGMIGAGYAAVLTQGMGCLLAIWAGRGVVSWQLRGREVFIVLVGVMALWLAVYGVGIQVKINGGLGLLVQIVAGALAYVLVMGIFDYVGVRGLLLNYLRAKQGQTPGK